MNITQRLHEHARHISGAGFPAWSETLLLAVEEIERLTVELSAAGLRERAALGQATLARQSAHELGDKLREAQDTIHAIRRGFERDNVKFLGLGG